MTKQTLVGIVITLFVITYASLGIEMSESLPTRTIVLVDTVQNTYVTIPCVMLETTDYQYVTNVNDVVENKAMPIAEPTVYTSTIGQARSQGFKVDKHCANTGGFVTRRPWLFALFGLGRTRVDEQGRQLW